MALPDFKQLQQNKTAVPAWAKDLPDGAFISYDNTYKTRIYFDLFDKYIMPCPETGDLRYYVYDPVKHGADPTKQYPVLMWCHGASNSLMEEGCIMCCGAEQFASPAYQARMGGAYLIVPLCNEERLPDGTILGAWDKVHSAPVKAIFDRVCQEHAANIGKKFIMGASSGGYFTWQMLEDYGSYFDGAMPIASGYVPADDVLDRIAEGGTELLIAHGRHDEMAVFDECIAPRMEKLMQLENCICFFPEWVYNGDGGVSSVFYGFEMGQHCMINWVQHDLRFDDGRPADDRLPDGVTGWIRRIVSAK
ncbi:MAG: hypothetical protein IJN57_08005 [Oscillospiraceae bacterium]|nr:hypothetical protein [Oscillospiraceae bacterium]